MRNLRSVFLGLLLAGAGFVVGTWHVQKASAANNHVYELRTYHCFDGKLPALLTRFREHTTQIFDRHGMRNIGYWTPTDPATADKTLIYVLEHDSREAAKKSWDDFRNDPEWKKVAAASEANGKIVEKVDSVFMTPTDFSKLQ
jgi:hypothetical protein